MPINQHDPKPPYRQIADDLRAAIQRGELQPGDRLPSIRELTEQYGVTHITADQALRVLRSEGLVDVRRGKGSYVRQPRPLVHVSSNYLIARPDEPRGQWSTEAERQGLTASQDIREVSMIPAPPAIAALLGIDDGSPVAVRRRLMLIEGEPAQLADSYYPGDIAEGTEVAEASPLRGGSIGALERLGFAPVRFHEEISSRMPTPEEVRALQLAPGVPVVLLTRTAYAANDRAVEVDSTILAADRHVLSYDFPARL